MRAPKTFAAVLVVVAASACKSEPPTTDVPSTKPSAQATTKAPASGPTFGPPTNVPEPPPPPNAIPAPPDVANPPADAEKTADGLVSKVLVPGKGKEHPTADDSVKVSYTGWTKSGRMFDSSVASGEPITFPLKQVIKGWTEGVQLMVKGEKRRFWIPAALAYGDRPRRGAPSGDLTFDIELLDILQAPKAPPDVAMPPATAKKTASGLAYKLLKPGTGKDMPTKSDVVTVHYSGWTTDGKLFDSSVMRGEPTSFPVGGVIKGWTEGLQLMHVGDKMRLWIPADLAYGDHPARPGAPAGNLVFDVELLGIKGKTPAPGASASASPKK